MKKINVAFLFCTVVAFTSLDLPLQSMENNICYWDLLPDELKTQVIDWLPTKESKINGFFNYALVNSDFKNLIYGHALGKAKKYAACVAADKKRYSIKSRLKINDLLIKACCKKNIKLVKQLLAWNADVNCKDSYAWTPLIWAVRKQCLPLINLLLSYGAKINLGCPLSWATRTKNKEIIELLLGHGADINMIYGDTNLPDGGGGSTSLMIAAHYGCTIEIVELLLPHTAAINARNDIGYTALLLAARNGHTEIVELLLNHGADLNLNLMGITPLFLAAQHGHTRVVELLLRYNVNVNDANGCMLNSNLARGYLWGNTALMAAAHNGYKETVEILLAHNAAINITNEQANNVLQSGFTSLMFAAHEGHKEIVELLLSHGAHVNARNKQGNTALTLAKKNGYEEIVNLLIAHGAQNIDYIAPDNPPSEPQNFSCNLWMEDEPPIL